MIAGSAVVWHLKLLLRRVEALLSLLGKEMSRDNWGIPRARGVDVDGRFAGEVRSLSGWGCTLCCAASKALAPAAELKE